MINRTFVKKQKTAWLKGSLPSTKGLCKTLSTALGYSTLACAILLAFNTSAADASSVDAKSADSTALNVSSTKTKPCYLEGMSEQLQCGSLSVLENPKLVDGKKIDIHFAILPAIKNAHPNEAMLGIAGGPGQSALEYARGFNQMLSKVRQKRDVLLIDQRGTGKSNKLACESDQPFSYAFDDDATDITAETKRCLDNVDADITQYGSLSALEDFEAVRQYLGYTKLHLFGVSYGTRMAQLYMRHYPEALATVTLDGVMAMQVSATAVGSSIERGLQVLFRDCQSSAACQQHFPDLAAEFTATDVKLAQKAITQTVRDPLTDETSEFLLTRGKFNTAIRMAMYMPNVRTLLPHAIHQASKGNYQPILGIYALSVDSTGIALGMHSSVVCGEDIHRVSEQTRKNAETSYLGSVMLDSLEESCQTWKMPLVDKSFFEPIASDIPTLLLSGELDPATPPNWGALAEEKLTNAKHFIAPYATHGVVGQTCADEIMAKLVESGSVEDLSAKCLQKDVRRSFYLNANSVEPIVEKVEPVTIAKSPDVKPSEEEQAPTSEVNSAPALKPETKPDAKPDAKPVVKMVEDPVQAPSAKAKVEEAKSVKVQPVEVKPAEVKAALDKTADAVKAEVTQPQVTSPEPAKIDDVKPVADIITSPEINAVSNEQKSAETKADNLAKKIEAEQSKLKTTQVAPAKTESKPAAATVTEKAPAKAVDKPITTDKPPAKTEGFSIPEEEPDYSIPNNDPEQTIEADADNARSATVSEKE